MQKETSETLHINFSIKTAGLLLLACVFGGILIPSSLFQVSVCYCQS